MALRCGGGAAASEVEAEAEYIVVPGAGLGWLACNRDWELRERPRPGSLEALSLAAEPGRGAGMSAIGSSGGRLPDGRVLMPPPPLSRNARLPGSP